MEAQIDRRGKDTAKIKPRKEREARVPEHLPAVDEVIEPAEVTAEPEAWRPIGEEVTEQLDYEPARFLRRRIIRKKYVKRDEPHQAPIISPLNAKPRNAPCKTQPQTRGAWRTANLRLTA